MNLLDRLQADMDGAVNRGACAGQHAGDMKWLVVMIGLAQGIKPVRDHE